MLREVSSMNSTRHWITPPREPVRPSTLVTWSNVSHVPSYVVLMKHSAQVPDAALRTKRGQRLPPRNQQVPGNPAVWARLTAQNSGCRGAHTISASGTRRLHNMSRDTYARKLNGSLRRGVHIDVEGRKRMAAYAFSLFAATWAY